MLMMSQCSYAEINEICICQKEAKLSTNEVPEADEGKGVVVAVVLVVVVVDVVVVDVDGVVVVVVVDVVVVTPVNMHI